MPCAPNVRLRSDVPSHCSVVFNELCSSGLALQALVVGCEKCKGHFIVVDESGSLPYRGGTNKGNERSRRHCVGCVPRESFVHAAVDDDAQQKLLQAREERNKMEAVRSHVEVELKGLQYVCAVVGRAPAGGGAPPLLSEQNLHSVCVKELAKGRRRRLRQDEQVHCDGANVVALVLSRIWRCCVVLVASQNASGAVGQVPFLKGWQHFCNFVAPRGRPELRLLEDFAQRQGSNHRHVPASQQHGSVLGAALLVQTVLLRRGAIALHNPRREESSWRMRGLKQKEEDKLLFIISHHEKSGGTCP